MSMKKIRDDGYMMGWEQGNVQMALSEEGLFIFSPPGVVRCNLAISKDGVQLLVGNPEDLAAALLSLTGEEPTGLLARFATFPGATRAG